MPIRNRLVARPETPPTSPIVSRDRQKEIPLHVPVFISGLNTEDDATDLDDDALTVAQNVFIRNQKVTRISGLSNITPVKPNSNPVRGYYTIQPYTGELIQIMYQDNKIFRRGTTWVEITSTGSSFNKYPNDVLSVDNRHFFINQGTTPIQEINVVTNQYSTVGNSPRFKYFTAFGDRLVGLGLKSNPLYIGWSGNLNYDEFDPLVDPSAGSSDLVESQSDYADFGTGIYGFSDKLLILKERSVWLASRTGAGTNPFYFYVAFPSSGCDTPTSIQRIPNGVVFYDHRTSEVYMLDVNNPVPTPIGKKISTQLYDSIINPDDMFSSFDSVELEYRLCVPQANNTTLIFVYSFKNQLWWTESRANLTSLSSLDFNTPTTLIGDLVGTIGGLVGTIGGLGVASYPIPTNFYGLSDGNSAKEDATIVTGYDTTIRSKLWIMPTPEDFYIQRLSFSYIVLAAGTFTIQYSKDGGATFVTYKVVTLLAGDVDKRLNIICAQSIRCRQYMWQIISSSGLFSLVDFKAKITPSGYTI